MWTIYIYMQDAGTTLCISPFDWIGKWNLNQLLCHDVSDCPIRSGDCLTIFLLNPFFGKIEIQQKNNSPYFPDKWTTFTILQFYTAGAIYVVVYWCHSRSGLSHIYQTAGGYRNKISHIRANNVTYYEVDYVNWWPPFFLIYF